MFKFFTLDSFLRLFIPRQGKGLFKLVGDKLQMIPGGGFTGIERLQIILPNSSQTSNKKYTVRLFYSVLQIFDRKSFTKFKAEADPIFKDVLLHIGVLFIELKQFIQMQLCRSFFQPGRSICISNLVSKF